MVTTKRIAKISWTNTLRNMKVREQTKVTKKEVLISRLRTIASKLKKEGYVFSVTSDDCEETAIVTREK